MVIRRIPAKLLIFAGLVSCKPAVDGRYLDAAEKAAAWIRAAEIRSPEGLSWPAVPADPGSVALNLYSGTPGVVLFFLQAYYATGNDAYLRDARGGADFLLARLAGIEGAGLYKGLSGIAYFLTALYMSWVQAEHRTRPDYLFAQTGFMQGAAGIGSFLFRLAAAERAKTRRVIFPDTPFAR